MWFPLLFMNFEGKSVLAGVVENLLVDKPSESKKRLMLGAIKPMLASCAKLRFRVPRLTRITMRAAYIVAKVRRKIGQRQVMYLRQPELICDAQSGFGRLRRHASYSNIFS